MTWRTLLALLSATFTVHLGSAFSLAQGEPPAAPFRNHRPYWSPDGQSIVFMSTRDGQSDDDEWELYTMRLDGTESRRVTHHEGWDGYASFSPKGRSLVYEQGDGESRTLMLLNLESGDARPLLTPNDSKAGGARFAPDGSRIVFTSEREGNREIYIVDADGQNERRATDSPETETDPCFSPDGRHVLYVTWRESTTTVDLINADGSDRRTIRELPGRAYGLDWSPDGSRIVFNAENGEDDAEIYIMNADGENLIRLTDNDAWDHLPLWSPDGRHLLFTSYRTGVEEIYLMNPDGSCVVRVRTD